MSEYLKVEELQLAEGGAIARVRFPAAANKTYTIQFIEESGSGAWNKLEDVAAAPESRVVDIDDPSPASATAQRFYRLVTPRMP
jgi:hypothetical protein